MNRLFRQSLVLFFVITYRLALSQTVTDSTNAQSLYDSMRYFFNKGQYDSTAYYAEKASLAYEMLEDWEKYLFCRNTLAYSKTYTRDLEGAAALFRQNIAFGNEKLADTSSEHVITYTHLSHVLKRLGYLDSALYYSELAIDMAENNPKMDSTLFARAYLGVANAQVAKLQLDKAMTSVKKGLWIKKNQQDSIDSYTQELNNTLAIVYYYKHNFRQAKRHYQRALDIATTLTPENLSYPAIYLSNMGLCYLSDHYLDSANYLFERSLKIRIDMFGDESIQASFTYEGLGHVNMEKGAYDRALSYFKKALTVYEKRLKPVHRKTASVLANMSQAYKGKKEYEAAVTHMRRAREIYLELFGPVDRIATTHRDLGYILLDANRQEEAKTEFEHALKIIRSQAEVDSIGMAHTQLAMARLEIQTGNYDQARVLLQDNLDIYTRKYGQKNTKVAETYLEMGHLKAKTENYDEALKWYQKGLQSVAVNFEQTDVHKNPTPEDGVLEQSTLMSLLKAKSMALGQKYERTNDPELLQSSFNTIEQGVSIAEKIRNSFIDEDAKLEVLQIANGMHTLGITSGYKLFLNHGDPLLLEKTWLLSERNKSSILRQTIFEARARTFSNIPDSLLDRENDLRTEISYLESKLEDLTESNGQTDTLKSRLFNLKRSHELLISQMEDDFPKYHSLKYNTELPPYQELKSLISDEDNLIEYHLGDSSLFIWVMNKSGLTIERVSITPEAFESAIRTYKNALTDQVQDRYVVEAQKIYNWLIRPIEKHLVGDRIIVVPDDQIWEVNFELLLKNPPNSVDYASFDYLIKKYAVSYVYSAGLLHTQSSYSAKTKTRNEVLAFSFGTGDQRGSNIALNTLRSSTLEDLPGSRKEIQLISEIFDGDYYFGDQASESVFKSKASDYAVLHLALHGEADTDHPNSSRLGFSAKTDSINDGQLYAYELYNLSLPADLAVLSACNTGFGQVISGEGMMTLGRAFTYAGCKSLVYTQWEIPDESAPVLMKYFYEGLNQGKTKDVALQEAKLAYLQQADPAQVSPLYWGGFVLQGATEPLSGNNYPYMYIVLAVLILLLVAIGYRWVATKTGG